MVRTSAAAVLLLISSAFLTMPAGAQEQAPSGASRLPAALSLSFKGGTVAQYVELINKSLAEQNEVANIIVRPGAKRMELPPVDLRDVTVEAALRLLHQETDEQHNVMLVVDAIHSDGEPIFILETHATRPPKAHEETVQVWNVRQLLTNDMKAEDMLTAIETALSLLRGDSEPAELRFHEATGLVMARGSIEQVNTIELVVQQLRETAIHQEMEAMRRAELEQAQAARADAGARMRMEMEAAQAELARFKQERDAMFLELQAARQAQEMHEHERVQLRDELQSRERELLELERRLQGKE